MMCGITSTGWRTSNASFSAQYANNRLIGAVAGLVISEESDKFAYRQGLFVIVQTGETVQLLNDKQFQPKHW